MKKELFSEAMVTRCAGKYKRKHREPPSAGSGSDCLPDGWRWSAIDQALRAKYGYGLSGFLKKKGIRK